MILAVHGGSADVPEDVDAARERIHPATMAAEGPLHDLGAISIINSDSQGMGRIGETIRRTWQLAHAMKLWRQTEAGQDWPETALRRRRAAGLTTTSGCSSTWPSTRPSRRGCTASSGRSDRCAPAGSPTSCCGARRTSASAPSWCSRAAGSPGARCGAGNATVEGAEPRRYGPHWAGQGAAAPALSATFVSAAARRRGHRAPAGQPAPVRGGARHPAGLARQPWWRTRPSRRWRWTAPTARCACTGASCGPSRSQQVPLSRRYLLG